MYSLEVTLHRAQDLPVSDFPFGFMNMGGKSDPYFVFKVGRVTHKSSVISNNLSPVWSPAEKFAFAVDNPRECVLEVQAWDYDRLNKDDQLGSLTIALAPFTDKKGVSEVLSYPIDLASDYAKHKKQPYVFLEVKLVSMDRADRTLELWENQRYHIVRKWTTDTFLPNDRKRWSSVGDANLSSDSFEEVAPPVPANMKADGWTLDVAQGDDNGWIYAPSFAGPWQKDAFSLAMVRRRKWINRCSIGDSAAA